MPAHEILHAVFNNFVLLRSGWEWEFPILSRAFQWEELLEGYNNSQQSILSGLAKALKWLADGRIPLDGLVRSMSPDQPEAVYGALLERRIAEPFVVLDWRKFYPLPSKCSWVLTQPQPLGLKSHLTHLDRLSTRWYPVTR